MTNSFNTAAAEFGLALTPLTTATQSLAQAKQLLKHLGWELPPGIADIGLTGISVDAFIDRLVILINSTAAEQEDELLMAGRVADLLLAIGELIQGIYAFVNALPVVLAGAGDYVARTRIDQEFVPRLFDLLISQYVQRRSELLFSVLRLLDVIELRYVAEDALNFVPEHTRPTIHYDRLGLLFSDPGALMAAGYGWGTHNFSAIKLLENFSALLRALSAVPTRRYLSRAVEEGLFNRTIVVADTEPAPAIAFNLYEDLMDVTGGKLGVMAFGVRPTAASGADGGIGFVPILSGRVNAELPIFFSDETVLEVELEADLLKRVALVLRPGAPPQILKPASISDLGSGRLALGLRHGTLGQPKNIVVFPGGSTISFERLRLAGGVQSGPTSEFEGFAELQLEGGRIAITFAGADGFLSSAIPLDEMAVNFDLGLGWSNQRGVYFFGSGGVEVSIPLHADLGPIFLDSLFVSINVAAQGLTVETSASGGISLGPLAAAVDRIGVQITLRFREGNLGPVDLALGFKPPNGLGIAIDAGPVSGGGYISFDHANGRYAGILQLSIYSVSVTAIGLLDTKGSDGQPLPAPGFSFLIIISAEFPPIQLGYGFTLNGVGGLAGIHRTLITEALQNGIRNGSVDHILFPEDPIRDAPQIISDLRAIFPPQENRFLFGPMALLGWGSPTLIEGEIGIILEVPAPIRLVLLGQVNVLLPDPDAPVVELHMDVLGILDFGRRLLSIDTSLHDSRIAAFTIYGDTAFRLSWGEPPGLAFSVGGLNPHFQPPPEFPTLRRMTVSLGLEDNPRVSLQSYMAVTSNSIQFGAQAELYAAAGELNVHGWLFFDALLTFSPFYFRFDFGLGFALRWGDDIIAGIAISGTLEGPSPWHLYGEGCISVLFFDACIRFDVTIGEREEVTLLQQEVWPLLEAAINDARNWSAALPPAVHAAVGFKSPPDADKIVLMHPMGTVTLHQNVVPLDRVLEKYGEFEIVGPDRFHIAGVQVGDEPAGDWERVHAFFASGQYERLTDAEKLSRDSFEPMVAGLTVGSQHVEHGVPRVAPVAYETQIVDSRWESRPAASFSLSAVEAQALGRVGAKAQSRLRHSGVTKYAPDVRKPAAFGLEDEEYVIVNTSDLSPEPLFGSGMSKGEAYLALKAHLVARPQDRERLQVVPRYETESVP